MTVSPPDDARVVVEGVTAGYGPGIMVLHDIDLEVAAGKVTAVLGRNGSGKSTLLRVLYGLLQPTAGSIRLDRQPLGDVPTHRRLEMGMAFLPQGHSVFGELSVEENLLVGGWPFGRDTTRVTDALSRTYGRYPLLEERSQIAAGSLSGGQQRILEIARMMFTDPDVLLIDEPSVGLAPNLVDDIYTEIEHLKLEGKTILLVDQNVEAAVELADRVYVLEYGRVEATGDAADFATDVAAIVRGWLGT